jgi:hypothetical protein
MKPGKGLRRTGFTNRGKPLRRYTELLRSSKSRAGSGTTGEGGSVVSSAGRPRATGHRIERDSAAIVRERSGGRCEIGIEGCWGEAVEKSHRIARGMGGRHGAAKKLSDRPSDLLDSCLYCHLLITRYAWRVDAKGNGWVLVDGQEPTAEPVLYRGELSYLDDAGSVHSFDKAGA